MERPSLTFFCELESDALAKVFTGSKVVDYLEKLNANLSLGLLDLSAKRAEVVKKLNRARIPVTAWILLPKEQGYWTSLDTINETVQRYAEFKAWVKKNKLIFTAVGLDIEPKIDVMSGLSKNRLLHSASMLIRNLFTKNIRDPEINANALIQTIRADGYPVETYQFPTLVDERISKSQLLSKTLGLVDLPSDREVLMLYTSFFPYYRDSIFWSYAQQCQSVAVGSTGGGVEIEGIPPLKTMRWIDLKRDLLLAGRNAKNVYIFSLEGCISNRYMDRLVELDWDTPIIPPERSAMGISLIRRILQGLLWAIAHPLEMLLGFCVGRILFRNLRKIFHH